VHKFWPGRRETALPGQLILERLLLAANHLSHTRSTNLFRPGRGILPPLLPGRERDTAMLSARVARTREGHPQHAALRGEGAIGKTTLLMHWRRRLQDAGDEVVLVMAHPQSRDDVLGVLAAAVAVDMGETWTTRVDLEAGLEVGVAAAHLRKPAGPVERDLRAVLRRAGRLRDHHTLVALIDDVDLVAEPRTDPRRPGEALGTLNFAAAAEAITKPLSDSSVVFNDEVVAEIVELSGGRPYDLQKLAHFTFDVAQGGRVGHAEFAGAFEHAYASVSQEICVGRWAAMSPVDRAVVTALARGAEPCPSGEAEVARREIRPGATRQSLRRLSASEHVDPVANGHRDRYAVRDRLFRRFLELQACER